MSRVLIMSSWTATGDVGLAIAAPVLQALGHAATQLPTVILSNHPGWPHRAGGPVAPEQLAAMIDAIDANGWLHGHDAFLAGYLPTVEHVALARNLIGRLRRRVPAPTIVVDPILGDDPGGLYVGEAAARAIRDALVPLADIVTPNRFELAWLTGLPVTTLEEAETAARQLTRPAGASVLVTSPPVTDDATGAVSVDPEGGATLFRTARIPAAPHGVGDAFSAMIAAGLPTGTALGHLWALIEASAGADRLAVGADRWTTAPPVRPDPLPGVSEC